MIAAPVSDAYQRRAAVILPFCLACMVSYALLMAHVSSATSYATCFFISSGLYVVVGLPLVWLPSNSPRYGKRTTSTAMQIAVGTMAETASPFVYPKSDGLAYFSGHTITFALIGFSVILWGLFWIYFNRRNVRRARGEEDWKVEGMTEQEMAELGDESPRFVYTR